MNFGFHTLVAADTRVTTYGLGPPSLADGHGKIRPIPMGLIAGVGLVGFVEGVKARLADPEIGRMSLVAEVIRDERRRVSATLEAGTDARILAAFEHTIWMVSCVGAGAARSPEMALAIAAPWEDYELLAIPPQQAFMLFPPGLSDDVQEDLHARLNAAMRPLPEPFDTIEAFTASVAEHLDVVEQFMAEMATLSDTVSASFQAAVHTIDHHVGLSGIYTGASSPAWQWFRGGEPAAT